MNRKIVLVDIDGTLSRVSDRVKCLQSDPPDWDGFYNRCSEDEVIEGVAELVNNLAETYSIVLCSGRRESCRKDTEEWLKSNGIYWDNLILLRKDGDYRHDTIVKPELVKAAGIELSDIAFVLEDRNCVVKKWREMGLLCLQVADGDF